MEEGAQNENKIKKLNQHIYRIANSEVEGNSENL